MHTRRDHDDGQGGASPFVPFNHDEIEQSIGARFEAQVARYPDRVAIATSAGQCTYDELNCAANRVAHALLADPAPPDAPVAFLLEDETVTAAAMLGALKAGRLYVPIDPALPRARIAYTLEDSRAAILLTDADHRALAEDLPGGGRRLLDAEALGGSPDTNPGIKVLPETPTWILYTSGSTGRPKGVLQTHRNVLHFVYIYTNGLRLRAVDRVTSLYSLCVNAGAHDLFAGLLNGAALCPYRVRRDGLAPLAGYLRDMATTICCSVPTVFRHFLDTLPETGGAFPDVRLVKLAGESVSRRDVERFAAHFPDTTLVNRFGSTETGTVRWLFLDGGRDLGGDVVPIGHAAEDNDTILVGEDGRPVPDGEPGEIAVRSRYLSPGYWHNPAATAAAFSPGTQAGEQIYRTGDLGRFRPDGLLEYLGRKDFQVKIRGYRIEPIEIELALLEHDAVRQAVVVARVEGTGDAHLVAYLVFHDGCRAAPGALRGWVSDRLPPHMVPSAFVPIDVFPLTPNGKIDRRALPTPPRRRPELDAASVAPRTPTETALAGIWSEVLDLDEIGVQDGFLDLGGHSLSAARVVSRVSAAFGLDIPLSLLFQASTVAEMGALIDAERKTGSPANAAAVNGRR